MRATASASRPKMASGSPCLPRCPTSPQRSFLAAYWYLAWSYPLLSLPFLSASHLCSEVRVPGAVGQEAAGRSLRPDSGRCFLRWHLGPPPPPPAIAAGSRGRKCAGLLSGRGIVGAGLAGACVSLALCCSERPRLRRNRRRCVYRGESLEVEGVTSPVEWLVNGRSDP